MDVAKLRITFYVQAIGAQVPSLFDSHEAEIQQIAQSRSAHEVEVATQSLNANFVVAHSQPATK